MDSRSLKISTYCILNVHVVEGEIVLVDSKSTCKIIISCSASTEGMRDGHRVGGIARGIGGGS